MGDKRLYFDEYENKQYYLDENGNRIYVESDLPDKKPDSSVKVAVIAGVVAIIVAIIGIIPLFPRETLSGETELVPAFCLLLNSQIVNSILSCGNQNSDIEIAVAATLTANAPTPNSVETSVAQTLTAVAKQTLTATASTPLYTNTPFLTQTAQITPPSPNTIRCLDYSQLATLGNILQRLESPPGMLAGLQIAFTRDWSAPNGWIIHRNSVQVQSVIAGDVASVWSPEACRPLDKLVATPILSSTQFAISSCPGYPNLPYWSSEGPRSRTEMVVIPDGQIAFIDTASVTTKEGTWSNGVFMTIIGPYSGEITLYDGAFCGGISTMADYQPVMQQRLMIISSNFVNYQAVNLP